jgi:amidase
MASRGDFRSVQELLAGLRSGRLRSEQLVRETLERISATHSQLNAVCSVEPSLALEAAIRADSRRERGKRLGALHGLPITIKDSFEVAGFTATCGATALRDYRPVATAPAVQRLIDAGAVVVGKTNVPTYSLDLETCNPVFGQTHNPWSLAHSPGGSSGGAAAAVAAGLVAAELGTDLTGSLRMPAHYCGIAAFKPGYGRVPLAGIIRGPTPRTTEPDLITAGPMGRSVADLRLLFAVLTGVSIAARVKSLENLRIAVWPDASLCPVDADVRARLDDTCARLRAGGALLDEEARPEFDAHAYFRHFLQMAYGEMSPSFPDSAFQAFRAAKKAHAGDDWTPLTAMRDGVTQSHRDWLAGLEDRERFRATWAEFFRGCDVLLTPVAPTSAPLPDARRFDQRRVSLRGAEYPVMQQTFWAGLPIAAGLPAICIPAGLDTHGLPVGLQLIGPHGAETDLLDIAEAVESLIGGFRPPVLFA